MKPAKKPAKAPTKKTKKSLSPEEREKLNRELAAARRAEGLRNFQLVPDEAFVRIQTAAALFGCSVPTIWRRSKEGTLPRIEKISARISGMRAGELRERLKAA